MKSRQGIIFPGGKSKKPEGIAFSRREKRKAGRESLFLAGIDETQQETPFPARNAQDPPGICKACRVLAKKSNYRPQLSN